MGRIGLNYTVFAIAADEMLALGQTLSYASLRARLGGGSNNTIGKHLDRWRAEKAAQAPVPIAPSLPAPVAASISIWLAGEINAIYVASAAKMNEQLFLRETLESALDLAEEHLLDETAKTAQLTIANDQLRGRIEQLMTDLAVAIELKLEAQHKLAAIATDAAVAIEKTRAAQSQQTQSSTSVPAQKRHSGRWKASVPCPKIKSLRKRNEKIVKAKPNQDARRTERALRFLASVPRT